MKAWVFDWVAQVSDSYHSDGGLMVVAATPKQAKEFIEAQKGTRVRGEYGPRVDVDLTKLDFGKATAVYDVPLGTKPHLFVFPDAGCC